MSPAAYPSLGPVHLRVRDLPGVARFYAGLLGLQATALSGTQTQLSAQGTPLLLLEAAPDLPLAPHTRPGLFHTAFLLPSRAALGRWLAHAARLGVRLGSGDHLVSEAFYLNDPEGNGIEVYADRPRQDWQWSGGQVQMDTRAVDTAAVLGAAGLDARTLGRATVTAAPGSAVVGHVHLKVGSAAEAARWYAQALGLDVVARLPGAAFLSWGGYHHHFGLNEWHTAGQGRPQTPAAGLAGVTVLAPDLASLRARLDVLPDALVNAHPDGGSLNLEDPWGNRLTVNEARVLA
ncbi:VOC family protein [Deinococcus arcticus]|uniref:Glyoxalase n=1 Tax=Deinococcus arcticus TaxID=2136176 RepID=A0A2T3W930_9DEIO|nr:VOC family protein [Deinococcus arcticus]PTA68304.1 glyoxalase [Deinococcus arcticus]